MQRVRSGIGANHIKHGFSEVKYAVRYPTELSRSKSKQVINAFNLPTNTPMIIRLMAKCIAFNEETKKYEIGELFITRKNIAFLSQNKPIAIKRSEIKSITEGKQSDEVQLTINSITGKNLKLNGLKKIDKIRAVKIIGHLIKQKDKKQRKLRLKSPRKLTRLGSFSSKKKEEILPPLHPEDLSDSESDDEDECDEDDMSIFNILSEDEETIKIENNNKQPIIEQNSNNNNNQKTNDLKDEPEPKRRRKLSRKISFDNNDVIIPKTKLKKHHSSNNKEIPTLVMRNKDQIKKRKRLEAERKNQITFRDSIICSTGSSSSSSSETTNDIISNNEENENFPTLAEEILVKKAIGDVNTENMNNVNNDDEKIVLVDSEKTVKIVEEEKRKNLDAEEEFLQSRDVESASVVANIDSFETQDKIDEMEDIIRNSEADSDRLMNEIVNNDNSELDVKPMDVKRISNDLAEQKALEEAEIIADKMARGVIKEKNTEDPQIQETKDEKMEESEDIEENDEDAIKLQKMKADIERLAREEREVEEERKIKQEKERIARAEQYRLKEIRLSIEAEEKMMQVQVALLANEAEEKRVEEEKAKAKADKLALEIEQKRLEEEKLAAEEAELLAQDKAEKQQRDAELQIEIKKIEKIPQNPSLIKKQEDDIIQIVNTAKDNMDKLAQSNEEGEILRIIDIAKHNIDNLKNYKVYEQKKCLHEELLIKTPTIQHEHKLNRTPDNDDRKMKEEDGKIMFISKWQLKNGMNTKLNDLLFRFVRDIENNEENTLMFRVEVKARNPLDYFFNVLSPNPKEIEDSIVKEIIFFECYSNAQAYSDHVNGKIFKKFLDDSANYFKRDPLREGWPKMYTTFMSTKFGFIR